MESDFFYHLILHKLRYTYQKFYNPKQFMEQF